MLKNREKSAEPFWIQYKYSTGCLFSLLCKISNKNKILQFPRCQDPAINGKLYFFQTESQLDNLNNLKNANSDKNLFSIKDIAIDKVT